MKLINRLTRLFFILVLSIIFLTVKTVYAIDVPPFTTCSNPGGTQIAGYTTGTHGIPGDYTTHTGSDYVYQTGDTTYVQCFCPVDPGMGIQTNWWNVSGLSQGQISSLENQGWIFIGNGAEWGLSADPYLALNTQFACNPGTPGLGGGPVCGPDEHLDLSKTKCLKWELGGAPAPSTLASSTSTSSNGQVLGASTTILADTSSSQILPRFLFAFFAFLAALILLV